MPSRIVTVNADGSSTESFNHPITSVAAVLRHAIPGEAGVSTTVPRPHIISTSAGNAHRVSLYLLNGTNSVFWRPISLSLGAPLPAHRLSPIRDVSTKEDHRLSLFPSSHETRSHEGMPDIRDPADPCCSEAKLEFVDWSDRVPWDEWEDDEMKAYLLRKEHTRIWKSRGRPYVERALTVEEEEDRYAAYRPRKASIIDYEYEIIPLLLGLCAIETDHLSATSESLLCHLIRRTNFGPNVLSLGPNVAADLAIGIIFDSYLALYDDIHPVQNFNYQTVPFMAPLDVLTIFTYTCEPEYLLVLWRFLTEIIYRNLHGRVVVTAKSIACHVLVDIIQQRFRTPPNVGCNSLEWQSRQIKLFQENHNELINLKRGDAGSETDIQAWTPSMIWVIHLRIDPRAMTDPPVNLDSAGRFQDPVAELASWMEERHQNWSSRRLPPLGMCAGELWAPFDFSDVYDPSMWGSVDAVTR